MGARTRSWSTGPRVTYYLSILAVGIWSLTKAQANSVVQGTCKSAAPRVL